MSPDPARGAKRPSPNMLLRGEDLRLYFRTSNGVVQAVDAVSFDLERNRTLAILGESGCGKSSLARALLRLLPRNVHIYTGQVFLNGTDVMSLDEERFRREVRWVRISLVPQAAMNALNPVVKAGDQVTEPLMAHLGLEKAEAWRRAQDMLRRVGLSADFMQRYPFELSGGMRQRAVLAMALVTSPDLVVMDEPTSALDVLTQANILNVLKEIKRESKRSFILITHDIASSSEIADQVAVMYAGQIVELADAARFYRDPLHPYSRMLMASVPRLREDKKLQFIPGQPPSLINPPRGCRFSARCPQRFEPCDREPPMFEPNDGRRVKCWLYADGDSNENGKL